jgi:mannitol/fructose-specific phosphotransferase system IIA component (Ntr-type)
MDAPHANKEWVRQAAVHRGTLRFTIEWHGAHLLM